MVTVTICIEVRDKSHPLDISDFGRNLYNRCMCEQRTEMRYWWKKVEPARREGQVDTERYWWKETETAAEKEVCAIRPRPGQTCPECGERTLAYNGLFILTCPECQYVAEGGAYF